jgi:diacylglycerol kinase (ATP)
MRTLLLHNPTAGDGSAKADNLEAALSRSGCLVTSCSRGDETYKTALREPWDLVAVAGGDGTVAKAARHLSDRNIPLALLPIGTANNVAHSLDLLGEAEEIAANLQGAPTRPLDLGSAKGPWGECSFIEAVGLGAFAPALTRSDPKPPFEHRIRLGREALCEAIAAAEPYKIALTVDGATLDGEFLFVEVLNLRFSGPRLPVAYSPSQAIRCSISFCFARTRDRRCWIGSEPRRKRPPRRSWCIPAAM